jgi:hypothetical protein
VRRHDGLRCGGCSEPKNDCGDGELQHPFL